MPRYSLRTLMIVVTVVAVVLGGFFGLEYRRKVLLARADEHMTQVYLAWQMHTESDPPVTQFQAYLDHHRRMREKYERASEAPWLLVEADPPEPKRPPWMRSYPLGN